MKSETGFSGFGFVAFGSARTDLWIILALPVANKLVLRAHRRRKISVASRNAKQIVQIIAAGIGQVEDTDSILIHAVDADILADE